MMLNGAHTISHELDIFAKVGRGVAHDEIVPFQIRNGKLKVNGETSEISGNKVAVEFVKVCSHRRALVLSYPMISSPDL